mmetsp:Transcript_31250/g.74184  ORF Transcript_31250/g.74184 Transcript_31250/m.74184 type:complete len:159 (-) Transcript_31250:171-647(-)
MPLFMRPAVSYWLPSRYFVMESFKDITDHNNKLVDRYARLVKAMAQAKASGAAAVAALEARGALKDEGMTLVLQILLMSECDSLFGSYASNVAILVHDLMHARMVARRESAARGRHQRADLLRLRCLVLYEARAALHPRAAPRRPTWSRPSVGATSTP